MIRITPSLLESALGARRDLAELYAPHLAAACDAYQINTAARLAHFLAQVGHESGALVHVREVWGPTPAQERYEGRADLGNTQPGDGRRYMGRGLLQTTGRANYRSLRDRLRARGIDSPDFEAAPELIEQPRWAALAACDYWDMRGINRWADRDDHHAVTLAINGGTNGIEDRRRRLERVKAALAAIDTPAAPAPQPELQPADIYGQEHSMPIPIIPAVAGLASALLPSLLEVFAPLARDKIAKEIGRHSDKPEVAAQVADGVLAAVKAATGAADPIAAVAAARADPAAAQRAEAAAVQSVEQMLPLLERLNAMEQANISSARAHSASEPLIIDTPWVKLRFVQLLSVFFVSFSGWFVTVNWPLLTPELRGSVIMLMMIAGWNGVRDYHMGSSSGSEQKTAMLVQGRRPPQ